MFGSMKGVFARPQAVGCEWQDRRQRPRMPKAPHVQLCKVLFVRRGFGEGNSFFKIFDNLCCAGRSWFAGRSGAQRNEESANREGVASGGATVILNYMRGLPNLFSFG